MDSAREEDFRQLEETPMQDKLTEKNDIGVRVNTKELCLPEDTRAKQTEHRIAHVNVPKVSGKPSIGLWSIQVKPILVISDKRAMLIDVPALRIAQNHFRATVQYLGTALQ